MKRKEANLTGIIFLIILVLFFLVQIFSLLYPVDIWWDSAVYLGMGKYIYSLGNSGLWEASRPIMWPIFLGFLWKSGLQQILFGKILAIILSTGCILLAYLITKGIFNEKIALISSLFLILSKTFFLFTGVLHTEMPSLFFMLLGAYLFVKNPQSINRWHDNNMTHPREFLSTPVYPPVKDRWYTQCIKKKLAFSGLFFGLAFMTRFFSIFAVIPIFLLLTYNSIKEKKSIKKLIIFSVSFLIPVIPYLVFNVILYKNAFYPFILQTYMTKTTGWGFYQPFYFYFISLFKENPLTIFSILGIIAVLLKKEKKQIFVLLMLMFTLLPFIFEAHKEMRFMVLSMPFLFALSACGMHYFADLFRKRNSIIIYILIILLLIQSIPQLRFNNYNDDLDIFYKYMKNNKIEGRLWISNPAMVAYSDTKAELIYYPTFDEKKINELNTRISSADTILINTCDIPCNPKEINCEYLKQEFIGNLKDNFRLTGSETIWKCEMLMSRTTSNYTGGMNLVDNPPLSGS